MRLFGRNDSTLAAALIVGAFILFHQPLSFLLDTARDIEGQYHLDLIQALVVLGLVFVFHQYRKRQEARADLLAAAAEAQQARLRSEELERLIGFSRALASITDFTGLSHAAARFLPKFTGDRAAWLLICPHGCWDVLVREPGDRRAADQLEAAADQALRMSATQAPGSYGVEVDDMLALPLMTGATAVGMVLVLNMPSLSLEERRALDAATAMTATAVRNVQTFVETRENSVRDTLTGCFNRAHGVETLNTELGRARRRSSPLSVVMFDVDEFKRVNDSHGHLAGDQLLSAIGQRLGAVLRTGDMKCRYGGDEFLVILPDTPTVGARQVADSIREELSNIALMVDGAALRVTISAGFATSSGDERDAQSLIARADAALYSAKRAGRNRACEAQGGAPPKLRLISATA